jgi:hypothetical protein
MFLTRNVSTMLALVSVFILPASARNATPLPASRNFPRSRMAQPEASIAATKMGNGDILLPGNSLAAGRNRRNEGVGIGKLFFTPRCAGNFGIGWTNG